MGSTETTIELAAAKVTNIAPRSWHPVFPAAQPAAWIAFVAKSLEGIAIRTSRPITNRERIWLAQWLERHSAREPLAEASYVTLALGESFVTTPPNGMTSDQGVQGVGSGQGYREPTGAVLSTVQTILLSSPAALRSRMAPGK